MNVTVSSPTEVLLTPMRNAEDVPAEPPRPSSLYQLCMRFGPHPQERLGWVHVPSVLQSSLNSNDAKRILRVTIDMGGFVSRLLPGQPKHVILAVITQSGQHVFSIPPAFIRMRVLLLGAGGLSIALGVAMLFQSLAPAWGAAFLLVGTHAMRTASIIPGVRRVMTTLSYPR